MLFWILTGILVVGIIGIQWAMRRTEPRVLCPECDGDNVTVARKEPLDTRITHQHTGLQGNTTVQTQYRVDYRCDTCHTHWTNEVTESS
jgi:Zn finger protein HypA/HybF involved in hydrogenase expression